MAVWLFTRLLCITGLPVCKRLHQGITFFDSIPATLSVTKRARLDEDTVDNVMLLCFGAELDVSLVIGNDMLWNALF